MKMVTLQDLDEQALQKIARGIVVERVDRDALEVAVRDADILIGNPGDQWTEILKTAGRPDDHPLWEMENVVIIPHIAGTARERSLRNQSLILENLKRFVSDEPLEGEVNKEAGY